MLPHGRLRGQWRCRRTVGRTHSSRSMLATRQCLSWHFPSMACCIILTAKAREKHNRVRKKQQNQEEATESGRSNRIRKKQQNQEEATESGRSITEQEAQHAI